MIVDERSVVVPGRVAALLAGPLRRLVAEARTRDGRTIPDEVMAAVAEFESVASAARETRKGAGCDCATPVAQPSCAPPSSELMNTAEVADLLECTPSNVRARAARGSIVGRRFEGAGWIFTQAAVEEYAANRMEHT